MGLTHRCQYCRELTQDDCTCLGFEASRERDEAVTKLAQLRQAIQAQADRYAKANYWLDAENLEVILEEFS
jgi:hypothetical protein